MSTVSERTELSGPHYVGPHFDSWICDDCGAQKGITYVWRNDDGKQFCWDCTDRLEEENNQ